MDNNFEIRKDELVGNLEMACSQRMVACSDGRIAFIENLQNVGTQGPVRLDAFIAVICLKGKASLYINGNLYEIYPGQVMICHPNIILEKSMNSMDFEFRCIALSKEYMQQMVLIGGTTPWDAINFLEKSPVVSLNPEEVKNLFIDWSECSKVCYASEIDPEHPDRIGKGCMNSGHFSGSRGTYIKFIITVIPPSSIK